MLLINISISVIIAGILIAFFTSRSIVKPINHLRKKLHNLSLGIYSVHPTKAGNDEIGDMANAVNKLITNFEKTKVCFVVPVPVEVPDSVHATGVVVPGMKSIPTIEIIFLIPDTETSTLVFAASISTVPPTVFDKVVTVESFDELLDC
jgi:HAMP domain-containing protein